MFNKLFDEVTKADIDRLVTDGTSEGRMLDYKAELPGRSDNERKEFARDVTSFANAAGGYIVYGVAEQKDAAGKNTGVAGLADGLSGVSVDQEILRMESMLRKNVDPIIPGVRFKKLEGFANGPIILLHIPKSWTAPHMVAFDNDSRFYSRGSAGKQSMDVREIRSAFLLSAEMPALIRRFRDERLGRVMAGETPVHLYPDAKVVMHLVPFTSLGVNASEIDLASVAKSAPPPMMYTDWCNHRFNFDGIITFNEPNGGAHLSYLQVFRSGALETVMCDMSRDPDGALRFYPSTFEKCILESLPRYLDFYEKQGIEFPIVVAITLLHFKGATLPQGSSRTETLLSRPIYPLDRDALLLPDVLIRGYGGTLHTLMRPVFDALWQSVGVAQSPCYDKDGNWSDKNCRW